ncbi:MAG: zf-HC2 domain-containing protein [Hyphomicrobiales bacterium]
MAWSDQIDEKLLDRLMAYVDGELDPKDRRAVEALIDQDDKLRLVVLEMRETKAELASMYRDAEEQEPPRHLTDLIRSHPFPKTPDEQDEAVEPAPSSDVVRLQPADAGTTEDSQASEDHEDRRAIPSTFFPAWAGLDRSAQWLLAASIACLLIGGGLLPDRALDGKQASGHCHRSAELARAGGAVSPGLCQRSGASGGSAGGPEGPHRSVAEQAPGPHDPRAGSDDLRHRVRRRSPAGDQCQPVAQLMYPDDKGQPLAFCVTKMTMMGEPTAPTLAADGDINLVDWQAGGYGYIVLGWDDGDLLKEVAQQIKLIYSV